MISKLIDFAHVVLWLLMLKVCGIIGISKIEFFLFSGTEKVKEHVKYTHERSTNNKLFNSG